jgi:hypothetical protein
MVPEFTCGKHILPICPQFLNFSDWLQVNGGNLMGLVTIKWLLGPLDASTTYSLQLAQSGNSTG